MNFPIGTSLWTVALFGLPFGLFTIGLARKKVKEKVIWSVAAAVVFFAIQGISLRLVALTNKGAAYTAAKRKNELNAAGNAV